MYKLVIVIMLIAVINFVIFSGLLNNSKYVFIFELPNNRFVFLCRMMDMACSKE